MTGAHVQHDQDKHFVSRVQDILREIERHKWLESEKAGQDIGGNKAALDWLQRHYDLWKKGRDDKS
jgi:hypothetical protein